MIVDIEGLLGEFKFLKNKKAVYKLTSKKAIPYMKLHRRKLIFDTEKVRAFFESKSVMTGEEIKNETLRNYFKKK